MSRTFLMQYGRVTACFLMLLVTAAPAWALSISTGPNGSNVQALHALGHTGQNVKIGFVSAKHALVTHEAFYEKDENGDPVGSSCIEWIDTSSENVYSPDSHDTSMAGMIASRGGKLWPNERGAAPQASIINAKVATGTGVQINWIESALEEFRSQGCRVVVTGFAFLSTGIPPDGQSQFSLMYDYYAYHHNMIFSNAAGNESNTIAVFGDAYNGITTGGLIYAEPNVYRRIGSSSGTGPTVVDERRKPEVAAPSQDQWTPKASGNTAWGIATPDGGGQTSWAVPHTAGVAAVLLDYAQTHGQLHADRSEVIKAVMVNSTFPNILAKNGTWTDPASITWHAQRGYGRLDALRAYETLSAPKIAHGQTTAASKGWAYQSFPRRPAFTDIYFIEAIQNSRLLTTMTWHRKVEKSTSYSAENTLNIGLDIYSPQGQLILSLSGGMDNLRKADILLETDGVYEIHIQKPNITGVGRDETRYYALAFEIIEPLAGDWNTDYIVDTGDLAELLDCWLVGCGLDAFEILSSQWMMIDPRYWGP